MQRKPVFMSDKRYDSISDKIYASYPNACILFIDEVINDHLESAYNIRKDLIIEKRGITNVKEIQYFHGTHANLIDKIANEGFDPTKNRVSAYGHGTYFAKTASYSFNYMKSKDKNEISYMFLADVLLGKIKTVDNSQDYDNTTSACSYTFGCTTPDPDIVVTPYPDGAYPRYIIAFHKNAK